MDSVQPKNTWSTLQVHLQDVVMGLIFPILCFTQQDGELWEEDPVEYVHKKIDPPIEDFKSPISAAEELLDCIVKKHTTETFVPIVGMINSHLSLGNNPPEQKYGLLTMMCVLADQCLSQDTSIRDQMEGFLVTYVFPDLASPHNFLRAKACDVITKFAALNYQDEQFLLFAFHNILKMVSEPDLPVRVSASLAISPFLKYPSINQAMKPHVVHVMQELLNTTNDIDLDTLTNSMELLVFDFAEELKPFSAQLATQLVQNLIFLTLVRNI
jgi:hypothetical protein